jgi:hypothetical protein
MRALERRERQRAHAAPGAFRKTDGDIIAGNLLVDSTTDAMVATPFNISVRESGPRQGMFMSPNGDPGSVTLANSGDYRTAFGTHSTPLGPCARRQRRQVVEGTHHIMAEGTGLEPYSPCQGLIRGQGGFQDVHA